MDMMTLFLFENVFQEKYYQKAVTGFRVKLWSPLLKFTHKNSIHQNNNMHLNIWMELQTAV